MLKKLTALLVAAALSLFFSPLVATSSFAQGDPNGSLSNAPPNGVPSKKDQPSHKKVKQPATSMGKQKTKK